MPDYATVLIGLYAAALAADLYLRSRRPPFMTSLAPSPPDTSPPAKVSIIVPARNAEGTIRDCLDSLISLEYSEKQVIVVEGGSSDRTRDVLNSFGDKITVLDEGPLPPGWVGKSWACHRGYLSSDGAYLLFTDADTVHSPSSLQAAVSWMRSDGVDVLSLTWRPVLKTRWERTVLPVMFAAVNDLARREKVNDDSSKYAWGVGEYIIFSRESYEGVGGHEAIRDRIDEDVNLATLARRKGKRVRTLDGSSSVSATMYDSFSSLFGGLTRNFYGMAKRSWGNLGYLLAASLFRFLLPFVVLLFGVATLAAGQGWSVFVACCVAAAIPWIGAVGLSRQLRSGGGSAVLLPVASLVLVLILLDAAVRAGTGIGVSWKGRAYSGGPANG